MKKKTIVILSQTISNDKIPYTSYVHSHALALKNNGYNVIVLAPFVIKPGRKIKKNNSIQFIDGIKVISFKRLGFSNILYKSKINLNAISYYLSVKKIIKKIIKEENVVLLDAHTFKIQGVVASWLKKKYKLNTFITLHGTSFDRNLYFKNGINSIKRVANIVDCMVCVSPKIERQLKSLDIKNTKVIYNGINFNTKISKKIPYSIITVGTFTYDKNIDVVIKSFKKVLQVIPNSNLTIIGEGVLKDKLEKEADSIKNITFTGFLPNMKVLEYLSKSEIFVLPSSPEGFGICYAEAMNNKCITIGTLNEGIDGFIKNKENGFLVNINETEIANLIIDIFNNKYDVKKIREKAYFDTSKLTWDQNAKEYIKLLRGKK